VSIGKNLYKSVDSVNQLRDDVLKKVTTTATKTAVKTFVTQQSSKQNDISSNLDSETKKLNKT